MSRVTPEPDFLSSFAALERSIRSLPTSEGLLPPPFAPAPEVLDAWLKRYREWQLPAVYLDYLAEYGGVSTNVPPIGIGIRPLATLLDYRRKRDAIGEVFETRFVLLSHANIDGDLCLVFDDEGRERGVALMRDDDDIEFVAGSFAMYLWSTCFFLATTHNARFNEYISFAGVAPDALPAFNRKLAAALEGAGFELLGADDFTICAQREGTCVQVMPRGPNIAVSLGNRGSLHALMEDRAELVALLEGCR